MIDLDHGRAPPAAGGQEGREMTSPFASTTVRNKADIEPATAPSTSAMRSARRDGRQRDPSPGSDWPALSYTACIRPPPHDRLVPVVVLTSCRGHAGRQRAEARRGRADARR